MPPEFEPIRCTELHGKKLPGGPCFRVNTSWILLSRELYEKMECPEYVEVAIDYEYRRVRLLKKNSHAKGVRVHPGRRVHCQPLAKAFPDSVGKIFNATPYGKKAWVADLKLPRGIRAKIRRVRRKKKETKRGRPR